MIAALGENRAIGHNGDLPWDLPEDKKFFREKTRDHVIVMGRKTLEALPQGQPLPNRPNIVISRHKPSFQHPLLYWSENIASALDQGCRLSKEMKQEELFVIGGGEIYAQCLEKADRMYLTHVACAPKADAFFPEFDLLSWEKNILQEFLTTSEKPAFKMVEYNRVRSGGLPLVNAA